MSGHDLADDDRLQEAHCRDRCRELLERLLVEDLPRLTRVGRDRAHRYLVKVRTDIVGMAAWRNGRSLTGIRSRAPGRGRNERPESLAQSALLLRHCLSSLSVR